MQGDIKISKQAEGYYEVEERGFMFTVTEHSTGWRVTRLEHGEIMVADEIKHRNLAFHAAVDNALMCYRLTTVVDAITKLDEREQVSA